MKSSMNAKHALLLTAWAVMLIVSDLPDMLITWMGGPVPSWMFWAKAVFLAVFFGLTRIKKAIRPLGQYVLALFTLFLALGLTGLLRGTAWFQGRFNYQGVSYCKGFAAVMVLDILVALAVIAVLWIMKGDRKAFFLAKGRMAAPIEPIRWLGIRAGESWKTFGWIFAGVAALGVAVPTISAIAPSGAIWLRALPLFPAAVLFAAVNAFTEEAYFRCSILSTLHDVIGKTHTLRITLVFFGLSHWLYGSPSGLIGFAMTGFLAWIMGRSMLETKGIAWPWIIHFAPDVVIFISYALLFVKS
ncbi:MAG: CPBP family intramembrane metalloprotease [Candidatus Aminicenantes bacterium]|nr:CPBP family intramembrane metalloprotease [Candidatus Aminicenantes bacterium]